MNRLALVLCLGLVSVSSQAFAQCTADTPYASRYPVAGPVNGGYDRSLDGTGSATYNCEGLHSNSDYVAGDHHGNDFFAAFRTPIIAVTDGVIEHVGWETGLGNRVGIRDACGWIYDAGHLDEIAPGWVVDAPVHAGDLLGYMGLTGARSNGVNHLHFNVHMAGLAWADDVDPFIAVGPVRTKHASLSRCVFDAELSARGEPLQPLPRAGSRGLHRAAQHGKRDVESGRSLPWNDRATRWCECACWARLGLGGSCCHDRSRCPHG